jgi:mannose-6-phosphate isomerase-like protein (cupin superfamily)
MQAWKVVIPSTESEPTVRAHAGHEWLYVLSGRLRLVLGDRDVVLGPGEVAEFDTRVPHWFGSTGGQSAEVLSLFGRHGEQMHLRTTTHQEDRD